MANNPTRTAPNSTISTVFSSDALASLTLTDGLQFDGTQSFSLGSWLLIEPGNSAGDLFSAGKHFAVTLSESGMIQGTFGTSSWTPDNANVPVSRWFYLLITVDNTAHNMASVSLYFDGALADTVTVSPTGGGTKAQLTIGGADFQSTAVNVFDDILESGPQHYIKPNWSLPTLASGWSNIAAVVDFTQNPPVDMGPSNCAISYTDAIPAQFCNTPALYFNGAGSASLTSSSAVIPQGHFSLGLWCYIEIGAILENQITLLQISNSDGTQSLTLSFAVGTNTVSVFVTTSCNGTVKTNPYQLPIQTWSVIGLNCDGTHIYLSVNDSVVATTGFKGFSESLSSLTLGSTSIQTGNGTQDFQGYIQDFFTAPNDQSAAEIYTLLTSSLGSQTYNCVLQFAEAQPFDIVTGVQVVLNQAKITNQFSPSKVSQGMSPALGQRIARPATGPVVPQQVHPHWSVPAKSNNPDILGYNLELYDQLLSAFPDSERKTRLRQHFQQKLQEGFDRAKTGDWAAPQVQCELINGKYRFTLSKPYIENDVYEIDAAEISLCTIWTIQVVAQCLTVIFQVLGVGFALSGLLKTLTTTVENLAEGESLVAAIVKVMSETSIDGMTFVKVLRTLYNANLLLPCIINGLTGVSWWNWAFVVGGIVVNIVSLWVSGGWYLAIMLAELAISISQLAVLATQKPQDCLSS